VADTDTNIDRADSPGAALLHLEMDEGNIASDLQDLNSNISEPGDSSARVIYLASPSILTFETEEEEGEDGSPLHRELERKGLDVATNSSVRADNHPETVFAVVHNEQATVDTATLTPWKHVLGTRQY
jgi:hypothetical protein